MTTHTTTQAQMVRMMNAVKRANRCDAVLCETVNGVLRVIPVFNKGNPQPDRPIRNGKDIVL